MNMRDDSGLPPGPPPDLGLPPDDLQTLVQKEIARVVGSMPTGQPIPPPTFEETLAEVDPADSEAALAMLDFLLQTGRLGRVGVLDGGQGYLFMYQEPKGSTKEGYRPGATTGDRLVDEAVNKQREAGTTPAKKGMCPGCYSVVAEVDGVIVLDDDRTNETCAGSPTDKHSMA